MIVRAEDKIVIFAMYKNLYKKAKSAIHQLGLSIDLVEVELDNFVDKAKEYKAMGKEIIVTRGGIGNIIESQVGVHVVEIKITGYDILKAINSCDKCSGEIGVLGTEAVCNGSRIAGEQLGIDVKMAIQTTEIAPTHEELSQMAKNMRAQGITEMIGMSIGDETEKYFSELGVNFILIDSEEISIVEAVQNAVSFSELTIKENMEKERLKAIVNASSEGIISVDQEGLIMMMNPISKQILKYAEIGKNIKSLALDFDINEVLSSGKAVKGFITSIGEFQIIADMIPLCVNDEILGAVIAFKEIKDVLMTEQKIRFKLAQKGLTAKYTFENIIGTSSQMKQVIDLAKRYSIQSSTVLITGETGTGKEVFAQAIHNASNQKDQAFVAVNCSALPANLLESELFGYSDGAFTGARKGGKQGLFELAHNGTIFLDEIGELDKISQGRLLRVIQEREVRRIGDDKVIPINVRIIAATNKDLYQDVELGNFRLDLYFRLDVLNLHIPPLKERRDDIVELVEVLLHDLNDSLHTNVTGLDDETLTLFQTYDWPGNVREVRNVLEKIAVITESGKAVYSNVALVLQRLINAPKDISSDGTLAEIEKEIIKKVLEEEANNKTRAAERLGITRKTINKKINE